MTRDRYVVERILVNRNGREFIEKTDDGFTLKNWFRPKVKSEPPDFDANQIETTFEYDQTTIGTQTFHVFDDFQAAEFYLRKLEKSPFHPDIAQQLSLWVIQSDNAAHAAKMAYRTEALRLERMPLQIAENWAPAT